MPVSKELTLGEQTYPVARLPYRRNHEWREKLDAKIAEMHATVQKMESLNLEGLEVDSDADSIKGMILFLLDLASKGVLRNYNMFMRAFVDMLFEYSPILQADRERIENEAYEEEFITALKEVVLLGVPLEPIMSLIPGYLGMPTLTNSSLPSTDNGTKKSKAGHQVSTRKR